MSKQVTNCKPKSYDGVSRPTPFNMIDDHTGEPLTQRADDTAPVLKKRLEKYHTLTKPVLAHYKSVHRQIFSNQPPPQVWRGVQDVLVSHGVRMVKSESRL